jgi:hypothetical protein
MNVHLDPISRLLQNSVDAMDILRNGIPGDCDDQNNDEDNIHCENTTMIGMTNRSLLTSSSTECIYNETQLRLAIINTPNNSPTKIEICSSYMPINASQPNPSFSNLQGIFIHEKILDIYCNINDTTTNHCILDAQALSRFFIIVGSQVSFHNIVFMNGNGMKDTDYPSGGAFYVDLSTIEMINCNFLNNSARSGGGIILFYSIFHLRAWNDSHETPITIQDNRASVSGGFVMTNSSIITIDQCHFKNNRAQYGGVLFISNTSLMLMGSSDQPVPIVAEDNIATTLGGVIFAIDNSSIKTSKGSFIFRNNMAMDYGGVIYGSTSIVDLINCQFLNNTAGYGGGCILFDSNLHLRAWNGSHKSPITIQGNHAASNGGFMYARDSIIMIEQYHFQNNSAQRGGVFLIWNTSLMLVGTNDRTASTVFEDNIATIQGGVIEADGNSIITTLNGNFLFHNNMAYIHGGAVGARFCTITMWSCHFISNKAKHHGGAMFLQDSSLTLNNSDNPKFPIEFRNNEAHVVCHSFASLSLDHSRNETQPFFCTMFCHFWFNLQFHVDRVVVQYI